MKKLICLFLLSASVAFANDPIKIVVPFAPGSATDGAAKAIQQTVGKELDRPFVLDHKPGAGGQIGTAIVANNKGKDTVLLVHSAGLGINNATPHSQYNLERDLIPVAYLGYIPLVLVSNPKLKAIPDNRPVYYGSAGVGSGTHLNGEAFGRLTKKDFVHVPYKGSSAVLPDLLSGQLDISFEFWPTVIQHVEAGKLNAIAVLSRQRLPQMPNVPTFRELGYKDFGFDTWIVVMANSTANPDDIRAIQQALIKVLQDPTQSQAFRNAGLVTDVKQVLQTQQIITQEIARYQRYFKEYGSLQ
jgi:tripartite-type tricarboxylate transporter receptor subunit TctC